MGGPDPVLRWPHSVLPHLLCADRFAMVDQAHEVLYRHPRFHALHLHLYQGVRRLAGREDTLEPGDFSLSPAAYASTYAVARPGRHLCVHFAIAPSRRDRPELALPLHLRPGAAGAHLADHLHEILRLHHDGAPAAHASALLLALLHELAALAQGRRQPARIHPGLPHLLAAIDDTASEDLPAAVVARRAGLSQAVASRLLRQHLGTTLARLRLQRRIATARHLLTATTLPVGEIGRRVGLSDPQHFSKVFRRFAGCSPGAARG